jgi:hypothetical protein
MQNYTLDIYYSSKIEFICATFEIVLSAINTILLPLMVYLITTVGRQLQGYKYILLYSLFCDYIFSICWLSTKGVALGPALAFYYEGPLSDFIGCKYTLFIDIVLILNKAFALIIALLYRRSKMSITSRLSMLFENKWIFVGVFIPSHLIAYSISIVPLSFTTFDVSGFIYLEEYCDTVVLHQ